MPDNKKPLAFIDVDGVLNRSATKSVMKKRGYSALRIPHEIKVLAGKVVVDPNDALLLRELESEFELAWGSRWENLANAYISPFLEMEPFPVVASFRKDFTKTRGILEAANGRAFVVFDDDETEFERDLLDSSGISYKLIDVYPTILTSNNPYAESGLTKHHVEEALAWARELKGNVDTTELRFSSKE